MIQLGNLIVVVSNQSALMEAESISKKEISLKSHKNWVNFFRKASFMLLKTFVIIFGLLFIGCSTPSSVVKKAMNAYIQKDADMVFKYYYNLSDEEKENLRIEFKSDDDNIRIVKFEIQDERRFNNRENAEVIVKCFFKSGNEVTTNTPLVKTRSGWKLVRD